MPIYEYRCQSCDHELEALVRNGKEPSACPSCEGQLARKISRAGIIFKGSGFYVNDSRSSSSTGSKSSSGSSEASSGSSSDASSSSSSSSSSEGSKSSGSPSSSGSSSSSPAS